MRVFDGTTFSELGGATLQLSGDVIGYTPDAGLAGSTAANATVTAVCENTDAAGQVIGVVAVIDAQRHVDFFSPAFSGLYVSGTDLGSAASSGRYLQGRTARNTAAPAPAPASGYTTYAAFAAAAPTTRAVAPSDALAWLAGSYYGRSTAGPCSVSIGADGQVTATMNGSTQTAALNGEAGDTWFQMPSNSMSFGVNVVSAGQGVALTGYAGRLALVEMGGVLDKCAIAFKSATPLAMAVPATPPLPVKSSGLAAGDLPAWLLATHTGQVAGTPLYPQTATAACSLSVGSDGKATLNAGGRSYTAQFDGGAGSASSGNRDGSSASRLSVYTALTGARDWVWTATAQTPSGSDTAQIDIELAYTAERGQVSYATGQIKPSSGGLATKLDACYFGN